MARPGRSPRPARPTAWLRSWNVRSAARSSGRFRATSDETTPTSVTDGMSSPLVTRLVPDEHVEAARRRRRRRPASPRRGARRRRGRAGRPEGREPHRGPRARAARCRRRGSGSAASRSSGSGVGERSGPAAVVAAQRHAGLVVDQRPLAVGAGLDVPAVPAQDDRGAAAPVEDEDRLLAGRGVESRDRGRQRAREQAALPRRQLGTEIDDLDVRRAARQRRSARTACR